MLRHIITARNSATGRRLLAAARKYQGLFTFMLPSTVIDLFLNNQPDAPIIKILFCHKTLHVSGNPFAHHQELYILHSALVSFMQVFHDRFQAESRWNSSSILTLLGS
jgi:hypothetical protein